MHLDRSLRLPRICVLAACAATCLPGALLIACGAARGTADAPNVSPASAEPSAVAPAARVAPSPAAYAAPASSSEEGAQYVSALYGPDRWNAAMATAERARWTPAMHAAAKALADATYPSGAAAIAAALKGTHRAPGAADRDRYRHPAETMAFFGLEPTMTVLDVDPGTGWYSELLAPALAKRGRYLATGQSLPKDGSAPPYARTPWSAFHAARFTAFLANAPELYGKVQMVWLDYGAPKLAIDSGTMDMVLMMREVHMMRNWGTLGAWLAETVRVLKPGGIGIVDHRAAPGAAPEDCGKPGSGGGRLPEAWVIAQVEAAGLKFVGKSEINANPKDTKNYGDQGVWVLPPEFVLGEKDHARYAAVGESDRMTLKFVRPR